MNINEIRPLIATPCYGGLIHEGYLRGFSSFIVLANEIGLDINLATIINESLVTRARNELVKYFLMSNSTHLFFIDADIQFSADDVIQLLLHDKDVVVGSYPLKGLRWSNLDNSTQPLNGIEARQKVTQYVINYKFENQEDFDSGRLNIRNGLIEVDTAGTGFMCIKRHVVEKIIEANSGIEYFREPNFLISENDDGKRWAVFETEIENGRYLSEDYLFCRRWQRLGGKVWLDPTIRLTHWGTYGFEGQEFIRFNDSPSLPTGTSASENTNRFLGG